MKLIPTLHPSYVQYGNWPSLALLRDDIEKALRESVFPQREVHATEYFTHPTVEEARSFLRLGSNKPVILDIETTWGSRDILCCGVSRGPFRIACLPWREPFLSMLKALLRDEGCTKVAHNIAFDFPILAECLGMALEEIKGEWFDTMVVHAVCEPDLRHGLEKISASHGWDQEPWKKDDKASLELYNCKDVDVTARAFEALCEKLTKWGLWDTARRAMAVLPVTIGMGEWGIRIDLEKQEVVRGEIEERRERAERGVHREVKERVIKRSLAAKEMEAEALALVEEAEANWVPGKKRAMGKLKTKAKRLREKAAKLTQPNLASPKQLIQLLYHDMGLPVQRTHEREAKITTNDDAIVELLRRAQAKELHFARPVLEALREHRKAQALLKYLGHEEEVVHPSWMVHGTGTGRLSCQEPNAQNIPTRAEDAWRVSRLYKPVVEGNVITEGDYSQIERRIQAWDSKDEALCRAFAEGVDVHRMTAAVALGVQRGRKVEVEEITEQERYIFKRAVYLESYGGGWLKLQTVLAAEGVFLTVAEAKEVMGLLKAAHPGYNAKREQILETVKVHRMLRNPFGRIRWFLGPSYGDALNFPYQSTAADVILEAMIRLARVLPEGAKIQAQIHDSLRVEHPPELGEWVRATMRKVMEAPVAQMGGWMCPVDFKTGSDWSFREAA